MQSWATTIVNPVNTVGVMGKGLALEFKRMYPEMFERYREACFLGQLDIGKLMIWKASEARWVLMFPTKKHWRDPSSLDFIEAGLQKFANTWEARGVRSIAFPRLGCGLGGLEWSEVQPLMEKYLNPLPISVLVYSDR